MVRELTLNRWNWSQKDNKWVFIESKSDGKLIYHYQTKPPEEFNKLILKIKILNDKLLACKDPNENSRIYKQMMKVSKRMQSMDNLC